MSVLVNAVQSCRAQKRTQKNRRLAALIRKVHGFGIKHPEPLTPAEVAEIDDLLVELGITPERLGVVCRWFSELADKERFIADDGERIRRDLADALTAWRDFEGDLNAREMKIIARYRKQLDDPAQQSGAQGQVSQETQSLFAQNAGRRQTLFDSKAAAERAMAALSGAMAEAARLRRDLADFLD